MSVGRRRFIGAAGAGAVATTLAGCIGSGDDEGVTIGHLAPLENTQGIGSERSAELAAEEINEDGGIRDEDIEVVSANTRSDPSTAQDEASRLINQENVDLLVGTFSSEVSLNIMSDPDVLMLDEPTLGLAPVIIQDIGDALERLNEEGLTILLAEQNSTFALNHAERLSLIETGEIELSGTSAEFHDNEYVREAYVGVH